MEHPSTRLAVTLDISSRVTPHTHVKIYCGLHAVSDQCVQLLADLRPFGVAFHRRGPFRVSSLRVMVVAASTLSFINYSHRTRVLPLLACHSGAADEH